MKKILTLITMIAVTAVVAMAALTNTNSLGSSSYTIAGVSSLCGSTWDPTDTSNDMTTRDFSIYTLTKQGCVLEAGISYEYKVCQDHGWDVCFGVADGGNAVLTVRETATYTVTFYFDANTYETYAIATKTDEAVVGDKTWTVVGNAEIMGSAWDPTDTNNDLTANEDGTYSLVKQKVALLADTEYEFKVVANHEWAENYGADGTQNGYNVILSVLEDGDYDITFLFSLNSKVLTISATKIEDTTPEIVPLTVSEIIAAIDAGSSDYYYVKGIISKVDNFNSKYNSITYWISADGSTEGQQFEVYSGKGLNSADFASVDDLAVGATVVVYGLAKKYRDIYEFDYNNYLISYEEPAPVVNPISKVQISGAFCDWGLGEAVVTLLPVEDGENVFIGTLDFTDVKAEQPIKLVINEELWLGEKTVVVVAPQSWGVFNNTEADDDDAITLYPAYTGFDTYTVIATWTGRDDVSSGWKLDIIGKDSRYDIPADAIWGGVMGNWSEMTVDAKLLSGLEAGDELVVTFADILRKDETDANPDWVAQMHVSIGDIELAAFGVGLATAPVEKRVFVTGAQLKAIQKLGLKLEGQQIAAYLTVDKAETPADASSVWVGEHTTSEWNNALQVSASAFAFTPVKEGEVIKIKAHGIDGALPEGQTLLVLKSDWNEFDPSATIEEIEDGYQFTIPSSDVAMEINAGGFILNTAIGVVFTEIDVEDATPVIDVVMGDVNSDGKVDVTDVVLIIDQILGNQPTNFNEEAADVNADGDINVTDVVVVIDAILGHTTLGRAMAFEAADVVGALGLSTADHLQSMVSLHNPTAYTAFQMDVTVPAGFGLSKAVLTDRAADSHTVSIRQTAENSYRIVCVSLENETFEGADGLLLTLQLQGNDQLRPSIYINNVLFVTPKGLQHELAGVDALGDATGIGTIGQDPAPFTYLYNLNGQRVSKPVKGLNIVNGKKIINNK